MMDLRVGRNDTEGTPWSVLSDLAITIVLVLVVFIVLQFIQTFRERMINQELVQRQEKVREALRSLPEGGLAAVDSLEPDRQRITFSTEVLFETCRADLKPAGQQLLRQFGAILRDQGIFFESVQIEGHTDRRPVRGQGINCPFSSNWELSSARATRVVTLLVSDSLLPGDKLSAIGRAEYHPVVDTALDPNRRIEVVLQYDRAQIAAKLGGAKDASSP